MKIIKEIVERIHEELEDSESYAKSALQYKTIDKALSDTYVQLSMQELEHVDKLHMQVARIIKSCTKEVPEGMQAVWNWEHQRMIEKVAKIKILIEIIKK